MINSKVCFGIGLLLLSGSVFSWNATGHRLVAQIAYDQLTSNSKQIFNNYNHALDKVYKSQSWINSAVWLDKLRYQDIQWFAPMHYVDLPFSQDGMPEIIPQEVNAIWAINKSVSLLLNNYATSFDKGVALRILLHVVGDIHQPLHAITRINAEFPKGDRGGNLVLMPGNPIANNLHSYWDKGGGFLVMKKQTKNKHAIKSLATQIERRWPCTSFDLTQTPTQWADESYRIAIKKVYSVPIDNQYQKSAQKISEKRIALAGCRLGALLNDIGSGKEKTIDRKTQ